MKGYVLDTNVFNRVLDGRLPLPALSLGARYYATHVQLDELAATRDESRRNQLPAQFSAIDPDSIPTESLMLDVSRFDMAKLSDSVLYTRIREALNERNKGKPNNAQDALIAETGIKNGLSLVTEDSDLLAVVSEEGGLAIRIHGIRPDGSITRPPVCRVQPGR